MPLEPFRLNGGELVLGRHQIEAGEHQGQDQTRGREVHREEHHPPGGRQLVEQQQQLQEEDPRHLGNLGLLVSDH